MVLVVGIFDFGGSPIVRCWKEVRDCWLGHEMDDNLCNSSRRSFRELSAASLRGIRGPGFGLSEVPRHVDDKAVGGWRVAYQPDA